MSEKNDNDYWAWITIVPASTLVLAPLFDWPYGYYQLLRLVVGLSAGFITYRNYLEKHKAWVGIFGFTTLLFNPLVPIHFEWGLWAVIDFVAAAAFGVYFLYKKNPSSNIFKNW